MPDFAPNWTPRYRFRYSVLGRQHSCTWRVARGTTDFAPVAAKVGAFFTALGGASIYTGFSILGASAALQDSDIFTPVLSPTGMPTPSATVPTNSISESTHHLSFTGRSVLGHSAIFFIYGIASGPEVAGPAVDNFRVLGSEAATIAAAVAILNNNSPPLVSNDGATVSWANYANLKYNDYWVRRVRA